jgi:hypothetical protein
MIPPVTVNGLGVREGLGVLLFAQIGISRATAFLVEFLTYVASVGVSLLGWFFYLTRRSVDLGEVGRTGEAVDRGLPT